MLGAGVCVLVGQVAADAGGAVWVPLVVALLPALRSTRGASTVRGGTDGPARRSSGPLLEVVEAAGGVPSRLFSAVAPVAVANGALLTGIMSSRPAYGMARDGLLPAALTGVLPGRRGPRSRSPPCCRCSSRSPRRSRRRCGCAGCWWWPWGWSWPRAAVRRGRAADPAGRG
ncbi:hypothetical protein ACIQFU_31375 [Streptomyces sp. NPDC093065]|uniref:hypothetical protein n=1 Tax=Streptomyces sp. NPDC093065 TaxID=3366021 RepID=UPI0038193E50